MEKVESIKREGLAEEAVTGIVLPAEDGRTDEADAGGNGRLRITEVGSQPMRAKAPSRELAKKSAPIAKPETGAFHRTLGIVKTVLPLVQKALPLLDGNVAAVIANILAPSIQSAHVDLQPLEDGVARLRADHVSLHSKVEAQGTALKKMGSQLESLNDAAEKLALDQKELAEEVHGIRRRVSTFAWIGVVLLAILLVMNVLVLMRMAGLGH